MTIRILCARLAEANFLTVAAKCSTYDPSGGDVLGNLIRPLERRALILHHRHAKLVSASTVQRILTSEKLAQKWTLKQVQGDEVGNADFVQDDIELRLGSNPHNGSTTFLNASTTKPAHSDDSTVTLGQRN